MKRETPFNAVITSDIREIVYGIKQNFSTDTSDILAGTAVTVTEFRGYRAHITWDNKRAFIPESQLSVIKPIDDVEPTEKNESK